MSANPFGLPHGPAVAYSRVLRATETTFKRLLAGLGGQAGNPQLTLHADSRTASVSWRTAPDSVLHVRLHMPALPPHTLLSRGEATRMVGLLVHELMHVLHTDRNAWTPGIVGNHLLDRLVNSLEDARIEAREINLGRMPGARDLFQGLSEHYLQEALDTHGWQPAGRATLPYLLAVLGRTLLGHYLPTAVRLSVPARMQPSVDLMHARLPGCRDTADVVELARDIRVLAEAIPEHPAPPRAAPQEPQDGQEDPDSGENPSEDPDGSQEAPAGQDGTPDAPEGQDGPQEAPAGAGEADSEAPPSGGCQDEPPSAAYPEEPPSAAYPEDAQPGTASPDPDPVENALARIVEAITARTQATIDREVGTALSNWRGPHVIGVSAHPVDQAVVDHYRNAIAAPGRLKDIVRRHLRAPEAVALEHRLTVGRLDRRAVTRTASGARTVMVRRIDADAVNVGVVLLLDRSASMNQPGKTLAARSLALHLGEACQHAGAECLIAAFTSDFGSSLTGLDRSSLLVRLKDWHQRMNQKTMQDIVGLPNMGGTPLAAGIMGAADLFQARPHLSRRIVLALTDGEDDTGAGAVEWACGYARTRRTEVIGILLGGTDPADLPDPAPDALRELRAGFDHPVRVPEPDQLTTLALEALARALRGKG